MEKNFKLVFNESLYIFIMVNILILIILGLNFAFNLIPAFYTIRFNLLVSFLIITYLVFRLSKKNKIYYLLSN